MELINKMNPVLCRVLVAGSVLRESDLVKLSKMEVKVYDMLGACILVKTANGAYRLSKDPEIVNAVKARAEVKE